MALDERMALIDEEINEQFTSITQLNLHMGDGYSQIICELCLRSLQMASAVKTHFIENQKKLRFDFENESNRSESPKIVSPEPAVKRRKTQPVKREQTRTNEVFVDPLQFVSVQEESQHDEYDNMSEKPSTFFNIKRERNDDYESFNYEEHPTTLDEMSIRNNHERKAKSYQAFNIPRHDRSIRKTEVGEKNFQCPHCKNYYKRKPHMLRHIEVAHMKVKFICVVPNCELFFVRKERLKKHLEINHADLAPLDMAVMLEKLRIMRPVYGSEVPEVTEDSQNTSGYQADESMHQDETDIGREGSSSNYNVSY